MTTSKNRWAVAEGRELGLLSVVAASGVVVVDRNLRIVAVHADVPLGPIGAGSVGESLPAADPDLGPAIAAAVERVLRTGHAETGVEFARVRGHARSEPVSRRAARRPRR